MLHSVCTVLENLHGGVRWRFRHSKVLLQCLDLLVPLLVPLVEEVELLEGGGQVIERVANDAEEQVARRERGALNAWKVKTVELKGSSMSELGCFKGSLKIIFQIRGIKVLREIMRVFLKSHWIFSLGMSKHKTAQCAKKPSLHKLT